jgi:N-methylhydantoinase B
VFVAMKALLDPQGPINEGAFRPFRVIVPPGSLLDAAYPAPMGGFVEVLRRVEAALLGAMSRCVADQVAGDTKGCGNHVNISHCADNGVSSIHYEYPAGGTGGFHGGDGSNAVREWDAGDFSSIHSAEIVEAEHPCLVEECTLEADSGGAGQWRGGLGLRRTIRVLGKEGSLSVLSDRVVIPPYGVNGGLPGHGNAFTVVRDGLTLPISAVPGKVSGFPLQRDDRVVSRSAGGGGFGDPALRSVDAIRRDVAAGYVTAAAALHVYGVDLAAADAPARINGATALGTWQGLVRDEIRTAGIERVTMSAATAQALAVEPETLVELPGGTGAPLRAVVAIDDDMPVGAVGISALAATILQHRNGAPLHVRALPPRA